MKKYLLTVACVAALLLQGQVLAAEKSRLHRIVESGVLRVGTTGDFNPMSFRNPATNSYQGYDIDATTELAKDMGVKIEYVPTDWKTLINGVVANKYDMTTSASLKMQRAVVAGYSKPYVYFGTVPMTLQKNLAKFDGWDSINKSGTKVAVTLGTVFDQQARDYFPDATIVAVEAPARDYQEVLVNRAEISITSNIEAAQLIKTYPQLAVVPVDRTRSPRPGAFLLPQDDQVWINFVNHWVDLKQTRGFFDGLDRKWFGK